LYFYGWKKKLFEWEIFIVYPDLLSTSPFVSNYILLGFRLLCALFSTAITILALVQKKLVFFEYFTQWNFTLLTFYFWIVSYFSLRRILHKEDNRKLSTTELIIGSFAWISFHMEVVLALFIDIVVWVILMPMIIIHDNKTGEDLLHKDLLTTISISAHGINFIMMVIEFTLSRFPFHFYVCLFSIMWACIYSVFQWIYFYSGGRWVYPFMNLTSPVAIVWYLLLFFMIVLFHTITIFIFEKFKAKYSKPPQEILPINLS